MACFTHSVVQLRVGLVYPTEVKSSSVTSTRNMCVTMRDRSKNRKQLQRGRFLSIEAIQTIQALKRAANHSETLLGNEFNTKFRRLLKLDMIAVLRELLRQNHCQLALKAFADIKKEEWYKPRLLLYAEMVTALGSNGLLEKVEALITELKSESSLEPDIEGFNALLESLMQLNLAGLAMECFYLMKSLPCDPDRVTYRTLINGMETSGDMNLLAVIQEEARKDYGDFLNFFEEEEISTSPRVSSRFTAI